jgi:hypothetical protein
MVAAAVPMPDALGDRPRHIPIPGRSHLFNVGADHCNGENHGQENDHVPPAHGGCSSRTIQKTERLLVVHRTTTEKTISEGCQSIAIYLNGTTG